MAQTTLIPTKPLDSKNLNATFKVSKKTLSNTQDSVKNINKILNSRIKTRKDLYTTIFETKRKRQLDTKRRDRESEIESKKSVFSGSISKIANTANAIGGSLLDRVLRAFGFIAAGWLLRNLPTWIGYGKEFIARINELGRITKSFVRNIGEIFQGVFSTLEALKSNLMNFDLFDSERKVRNSFDDLKKSIEGLGKDFEDTINVFTTDITKEIDGVRVGSYSGEEIPEPGEGFTDSSGTSSQSTPTGYGNVFELIAGGEGGYESINRGSAGDSPGGAKKYLGKDLRDMTLSEIMSLQARGKVFAVGKYQIIDKTMPGFIKFLQTKGYDPSKTKFSESIQDLYPEYTITSKRPIVGKYLRGESGVTVEDAAQELAREFASVGLSRPEAGRGVGQSRYAGTAGNKASISPQQVQQALRQARESGSSTSAKASPKITTLPAGKGNAIFGETGRVSNAAGWVHGHFQTNTGTANDLINDTAPIVKGLVDAGIPAELSRGQKFTKNMSMDEIKQLIRVGLTQHGHSGDGRSVDIFVPKGTKVPFPLYDVSNTGGRGGVTGILPGTGKVWVGHLDPKSKSGGELPQQAQISSAPTQQRQQAVAQQITPERKGQDIAVVVPSQQPQQQSTSASQKQEQAKAPSVGEMLNNFVKQKFLLDLGFL